MTGVTFLILNRGRSRSDIKSWGGYVRCEIGELKNDGVNTGEGERETNNRGTYPDSKHKDRKISDKESWRGCV